MKNIIILLLMVLPAFVIGQTKILTSSKTTSLLDVPGRGWVVQKTKYENNIWEIQFDRIVWVTKEKYFNIISIDNDEDEITFDCLGDKNMEVNFSLRENVFMVLFGDRYQYGVVFELDRY